MYCDSGNECVNKHRETPTQNMLVCFICLHVRMTNYLKIILKRDNREHSIQTDCILLHYWNVHVIIRTGHMLCWLFMFSDRDNFMFSFGNWIQLHGLNLIFMCVFKLNIIQLLVYTLTYTDSLIQIWVGMVHQKCIEISSTELSFFTSGLSWWEYVYALNTRWCCSRHVGGYVWSNFTCS